MSRPPYPPTAEQVAQNSIYTVYPAGAEQDWLDRRWPPDAARLAVRGKRIAQMIERRERELEWLRGERDEIIEELDRVSGMTSRELGAIMHLSHVRVRRVLNERAAKRGRSGSAGA